MAKKSRREKELARLRREVEVLRAQLARQKGPPAVETPTKQEPAEEPKMVEEPRAVKAPKTQPTIPSVDPKFIKADLLRSGILTLIAFGIIVTLTFIF